MWVSVSPRLGPEMGCNQLVTPRGQDTVVSIVAILTSVAVLVVSPREPGFTQGPRYGTGNCPTNEQLLFVI